MTYTAQAAQYREMEVLAATPAQLVVILFDHLLVTLHRARFTMDAAGAERRGELLGKCRAVVTELLVTLDHERGGAIAAELSGLYTFLLRAFLELATKPDVAYLARVTEVVQNLRDGFAGAAANPELRAAS